MTALYICLAALCAIALAALALAAAALRRRGETREENREDAQAARALHAEALAALARQNRELMDAATAPLREQMQRLERAVQKSDAERANLGENIARSVGAIGEIAGSLSKTAGALKSDIRVQGRNGEDILAEKLRQAGLEENTGFFLQDGTDTERPDAQVCDPENRWLVIDSKVSLTAYIEYAQARDEETRKARLADHVTSVRRKIDQLARKRYPATLAAKYPQRNYLPVTAMFVPYDAPLAAALEADASLMQFAAQNNVVIVTPLSLMAWLRLVYLAWQHEKEERNREEITNTARELLARMNSYLVAFEKVGKAISSLQDTYEDAKGVIVDAPRTHTIAKAASRLVELHVRLENKRGRRLETAKCISADGSPEEPSGEASSTGADSPG